MNTRNQSHCTTQGTEKQHTDEQRRHRTETKKSKLHKRLRALASSKANENPTSLLHNLSKRNELLEQRKLATPWEIMNSDGGYEQPHS